MFSFISLITFAPRASALLSLEALCCSLYTLVAILG